jgi:hypothetical protein
MSTPLDCYSLTYQFYLYRVTTHEDLAEFTLWYDTDGAEYGDAELAHAAAGGAKAWTDNVSPLSWASNVLFHEVVATAYKANGHTNAVQTAPPPSAWVGTSVAPALPWETSLACSLYTYPRGAFVSDAKRKRGRFYLPPMASDQLDHSNSGFFENSTINALLTELHTFLEASQENELGAKIGTLSVFSRADSVLRAVTQISIDAKFDSQRRRQNRETAGYITASF